MSKDIYVGAAGKARRVTDIYIGAGGVARKVWSGYIGDAEGKARLFYGVSYPPYTPGIITPSNMTANNAPAPYRAASRDYLVQSNDWQHQAYGAFNSSVYVDAISTVCFAVGSDVPTYGEWWVEIDLGEPRFANRGRIWRRGDDATYGFPKDFQLLGSNDAAAWDDVVSSDKWSVLGDITGYETAAGDGQWADYFQLDRPGYYRYYRLKVTRVNKPRSANQILIIFISEMELSAV
jgi:hypothetical protein